MRLFLVQQQFDLNICTEDGAVLYRTGFGCQDRPMLLGGSGRVFVFLETPTMVYLEVVACPSFVHERDVVLEDLREYSRLSGLREKIAYLLSISP